MGHRGMLSYWRARLPHEVSRGGCAAPGPAECRAPAPVASVAAAGRAVGPMARPAASRCGGQCPVAGTWVHELLQRLAMQREPVNDWHRGVGLAGNTHHYHLLS